MSRNTFTRPVTLTALTFLLEAVALAAVLLGAFGVCLFLGAAFA